MKEVMGGQAPEDGRVLQPVVGNGLPCWNPPFCGRGEENRAEKTSQVWEDEGSREFGLNWLEHSDMFEAELGEWN